VSLLLDELAARHPSLAPLCPAIGEAATRIVASQRAGGTIFICGNGGSSSDADHIAAELLKSFGIKRPLTTEERQCFSGGDAELLGATLERGVRAISLSHPASLMTAVCNDTEAALVFAQPLWALARAGDVLLAISTSGNSRNVVLAAQTARALGVTVIGLTGEGAATLDDWCDIALKVPGRETYKIQELHLPVYHALCLLIEQELFGPSTVEIDRTCN
jgi:D-sedoheptulose 7-phosphate isomerase